MVFIELEGIIEINNDIFDLEMDEKWEIYCIFWEFSVELCFYWEDICIYQDIFIYFDFVQVKVCLAWQMNVVMLKMLFSYLYFGVRQGWYLFLYFKNKCLNKVIVLFDFNFFKGNCILMFSGLNVGGKLIIFKFIGLMQLML